ncbi:MAG: cytochrome c oxidase subunit II [Candidatus Tectomicrobia bacterium]|nr:cytochrome c oxidase subunit II [Candidatus Tectomicrobia bacterium]
MLSWLPENIASYGDKIDSLMYLVYYITGTAFVVTELALIIFLILYRRKPGRPAAYITGNRARQALWTLVPLAVILAIDLSLDFKGTPVWNEVKAAIPPSNVLVQVQAKQFNWEVHYPGPDGKLGTADDLVMDNQLHVPVNQVVKVRLKSQDVIHSLFLPNLRFKQDVLPGREIDGWFKATKTGTYPMPCAELCGFGHSGMYGQITVHSAEDYQAWVRQQWPSS